MSKKVENSNPRSVLREIENVPRATNTSGKRSHSDTTMNQNDSDSKKRKTNYVPPIELIAQNAAIGGLFLGGSDAAKSLTENNQFKIMSVLNVNDTVSEIDVKGINVENILLKDALQGSDFELVDKTQYSSLAAAINSAMDFIEKNQCGGRNVLVHCRMGISRSTFLCIVYMVKRLNMTIETVLNIFQQKEIEFRTPIERPVWQDFFPSTTPDKPKRSSRNKENAMSGNTSSTK